MTHFFTASQKARLVAVRQVSGPGASGTCLGSKLDSVRSDGMTRELYDVTTGQKRNNWSFYQCPGLA